MSSFWIQAGGKERERREVVRQREARGVSASMLLIVAKTGMEEIPSHDAQKCSSA